MLLYILYSNRSKCGCYYIYYTVIVQRQLITLHVRGDLLFLFCFICYTARSWWSFVSVLFYLLHCTFVVIFCFCSVLFVTLLFIILFLFQFFYLLLPIIRLYLPNRIYIPGHISNKVNLYYILLFMLILSLFIVKHKCIKHYFYIIWCSRRLSLKQ